MSRRWLLPLLIVAVVAGVVGVLVVRTLQRNDNPSRAVHRYLDALERGETRIAYNQLCEAFHKAITLEAYNDSARAEQTASGDVTDTQLEGIQNRPNNQRLATYTVERERSDSVVDAALVREEGAWRICGFKSRSEVPDTGATTTTR